MQPWEGVDMAVCHVAVTCSSAVQHPWRVSQLLQESHAFHLAAQGSSVAVPLNSWCPGRAQVLVAHGPSSDHTCPASPGPVTSTYETRPYAWPFIPTGIPACVPASWASVLV